jgi:hypothetical protein
MTPQLITAAFFLVSTFYGTPTTDMKTEKPVTVEAEIPHAVLANNPLTLEEYVREYYRDTPILSEIARCETRFRHLSRDGRILRGELSWTDGGVMQINEFYHGERAAKLDFDLQTREGNLAYAQWLYEKEGAAPWHASSKCWQEFEHLALGTPKNDNRVD